MALENTGHSSEIVLVGVTNFAISVVGLGTSTRHGLNRRLPNLSV